MNYYIELTLIPDAEISPFFLWSKLYTQIHLGLVEMLDADKAVPIGISFPEYAKDRLLGQKLRLFALDEATLIKFDVPKWLARLTDYVHCTTIRAVPQNRVTGYASYQRYRPKQTIEQRAQHQAERRKVSYEDALAHFKGYKEDESNLPYIQLKSLSNGQSFRLIIVKKAVAPPQEKHRIFNSFGLSNMGLGTPIPEF